MSARSLTEMSVELLLKFEQSRSTFVRLHFVISNRSASSFTVCLHGSSDRRAVLRRVGTATTKKKTPTAAPGYLTDRGAVSRCPPAGDRRWRRRRRCRGCSSTGSEIGRQNPTWSSTTGTRRFGSSSSSESSKNNFKAELFSFWTLIFGNAKYSEKTVIAYNVGDERVFSEHVDDVHPSVAVESVLLEVEGLDAGVVLSYTIASLLNW